MCLVTRQEALEEALVRFALSPQGVVVPDLAAKLPGRGVWITCSRAILEEAIKKRAFSRGFEGDATVPDGLSDMVSGLLRKQAVNHLSLGRKAGDAVQGFTKVEEALRKAQVRLLMHVSGAAADGKSKLDRLRQPSTVITDSLRSDEMDLAFGRTNVVHAAVTAGGLAERLLVLLKRMTNFEGWDLEGPEGQKKSL
jgi:uncharacterized protein